MAAANKLSVLKQIGLRPVMLSRGFNDEETFGVYVSEEYKKSSFKDSDEVYRMCEMIVVHKPSGMRFKVLKAEDYTGDEVKYTVTDIFIITIGQKQLEVLDVNFTEQCFITAKGKVLFSQVKKTFKGD